MRHHARFRQNRGPLLRRQEREPPLHRLFDIGRFHGFKFKNGRTAEYGTVNIKIRVLSGGGDQGDPPVFDMLQQGLLLLFIEILDLVEIQENATDAREGVELLHHRLDIGGWTRWSR